MLGKHKLDVRYLLIFDTTEMIVFVWAVFFNYDKGIGFEILEMHRLVNYFTAMIPITIYEKKNT